MQRKGRGTCDGSELFRGKAQLYRKVYDGFLGPGRLGGVAEEGETMASRRSAAGSVNRTEHHFPAHSGLRPLYTTKEWVRSVRS